MNVTSLDPALLSAGFNRGFPRGPSSNQKFHKFLVDGWEGLGITAKMWWSTKIWVFSKIGVPQNGWFMMENPIKMDDLGYHYFWKHPYQLHGVLPVV